VTEADRYWQRKVSANKALANKDAYVRISSAALEKEVRKAFEEGKRIGTRQGYKLGQNSQVSNAEQNVLDDLFKQLGDN
jgi:flagellar biosynthesis/type III secretory pathway protein FliH